VRNGFDASFSSYDGNAVTSYVRSINNNNNKKKKKKKKKNKRTITRRRRKRRRRRRRRRKRRTRKRRRRKRRRRKKKPPKFKIVRLRVKVGRVFTLPLIVILSSFSFSFA